MSKLPATIKLTIFFENTMWVGIFERTDEKCYVVARVVFGEEPTDPELYAWISNHYQELEFSQPQQFKLIIKRKNPKRLKREVKKFMQRTPSSQLTYAQDQLKIDLERHKKIKKSISKQEREKQEQHKFLLKQKKKKQKHRGH